MPFRKGRRSPPASAPGPERETCAARCRGAAGRARGPTPHCPSPAASPLRPHVAPFGHSAADPTCRSRCAEPASRARSRYLDRTRIAPQQVLRSRWNRVLPADWRFGAGGRLFYGVERFAAWGPGGALGLRSESPGGTGGRGVGGGQLGGVEAGPSTGPAFGLFYPLTLGKSVNHPEPQFLHPQNERVNRDDRVGTGTGERRAAQHAEARGNGRPARQDLPPCAWQLAPSAPPGPPAPRAGCARPAGKSQMLAGPQFPGRAMEALLCPGRCRAGPGLATLRSEPRMEETRFYFPNRADWLLLLFLFVLEGAWAR